MRVSMKQLQTENEALRAKLEEQRLEIADLRERAAASKKPRAPIGIPKHVLAKFFAAHPGARSATPDEIRAWATH